MLYIWSCYQLYPLTIPTLKNTSTNKHSVVFRTSVYKSLFSLLKIPRSTFYSTQKTRTHNLFVCTHHYGLMRKKKENSFFHPLLKTVLCVAAPTDFCYFFCRCCYDYCVHEPFRMKLKRKNQVKRKRKCVTLKSIQNKKDSSE